MFFIFTLLSFQSNNKLILKKRQKKYFSMTLPISFLAGSNSHILPPFFTFITTKFSYGSLANFLSCQISVTFRQKQPWMCHMHTWPVSFHFHLQTKIIHPTTRSPRQYAWPSIVIYSFAFCMFNYLLLTTMAEALVAQWQ